MAVGSSRFRAIKLRQMPGSILKDDHEKLAELLQRLQTGLEQDRDPGQTFQLLDLFWALLAMHIRAEHLWLFPAILNARRPAFGSHGVPSYEEAVVAIERLKLDHNFFMDELAAAVKIFREILIEPPATQNLSTKVNLIKSRVNDVAQRLELHNASEEGEVYQWPTSILTARELVDLSALLKRELENLPARFRAS